jgi:hypothetical protein
MAQRAFDMDFRLAFAPGLKSQTFIGRNEWMTKEELGPQSAPGLNSREPPADIGVAANPHYWPGALDLTRNA